MVDSSIVLILAVLFLSNTIYGLASPFLPRLLEDRGISESWTGLIFATYAIAYMIGAPVIGSLVDKIGHGVIMTVGILLMSGAIASFGTAINVDTNEKLIGMAIGLRAVQGKQLHFCLTLLFA